MFQICCERKVVVVDDTPGAILFAWKCCTSEELRVGRSERGGTLDTMGSREGRGDVRDKESSEAVLVALLDWRCVEYWMCGWDKDTAARRQRMASTIVRPSAKNSEYVRCNATSLCHLFGRSNRVD